MKSEILQQIKRGMEEALTNMEPRFHLPKVTREDLEKLGEKYGFTVTDFERTEDGTIYYKISFTRE